MKFTSLLSALAVCLGLTTQLAQAVTCDVLATPLTPSNPDAAYIVTPSDGTATDSRTGLTWKRCSEGQTWAGGTCTGTAIYVPWNQALATAPASSFAGHSDWRVPNVKELRSLVEECRGYPSINNVVFPGMPTSPRVYWTSSPYMDTGLTPRQNMSWYVNFDLGSNVGYDRISKAYVWLVRGGDSFDNSAAGVTTTLLSVSAGGSGSGGVTTDVGGINCTSTAGSLSGTCLATLTRGSSVTLTASAAVGSSFYGWGGAGGVCGGSATCTLSMPAAQSVSAIFVGPGGGGATAPAAPINLVASTPVDGGVSLAFTPASDGGSPILDYRATCTGGATAIGTASSSPVTVSGMTYGTLYSCSVRARNVVGYSAPSVAVSVTPTGTCTWALASPSTSVSSGVNVGTVGVTSPCAWTAVSNVGWVTITSGASGSGNGSVGYSVAANVGVGARTGTLTIATQTFTVNQAGTVSPPFCALVANPAVVVSGGSSTLTATCSPAADSYTWTGGTCVGTVGATCTVSPTSAVTYTVAGTNVNGLGVAASATVSVFSSASILTNISTRGYVGTTDNVMIGGFIISGSVPISVLIRARGPSLAAFGVTGVLANPSMKLYLGPTLLDSNDDWGGAPNAAAISASGSAPSSPLESAILTTLAPGAYTTIVSGVGGSTGVAIVEVLAQ